jgi:hypothetical protein
VATVIELSAGYLCRQVIGGSATGTMLDFRQRRLPMKKHCP